MIAIEKTNEKGDKTTVFTHQSYMSKDYNSKLSRQAQINKSITMTCFSVTGLATYWAGKNVPFITNFIHNTLKTKSFFAVAIGAALIDSFLVASIFSSSLKSKKIDLLRNEVFPTWNQSERVVNPDRVFFQLNDDHHNELNIWHSGITHSTVSRMMPDAIHGDPKKPHAPTAHHHQHH